MKDHCLKGKTITAVYLSADAKALRFDIEHGDPIIAQADGDCCSETWIESVDAPERLIGEPVLSAEDIEMPDLGTPEDKECVAYYGFKIVTAKGDVVVDYRNNSNGYYGGSLEWPGEYFYGGVYGQNVSNNEWRKLA